MDKPANHDPVLTRFNAALRDIYGPRVHRIVLFGSRARRDGCADADYDVAVFLTALPDRWSELDRLADLRTRFLEETGQFFDVKPYEASAYDDGSPLMHQIRRDGREL